jgi:four helix bundle protein
MAFGQSSRAADQQSSSFVIIQDMAKYKNLIVWQKSNELALRVYKLTEDFPKKETFGITSQLRRAALSIPTNIVEGYGRRSKTELSHFIDMARGSLAETEYLPYFKGACPLRRFFLRIHKKIQG